MSIENALALASKLAPTAQRFERMLSQEKYEINSNSALIPQEALPKIIDELEALSAPTSPERAIYWARLLVGCYPSRKVNDPKIYVLAISALFAETPEDLCALGVDIISRRFRSFSSRADIDAVLTELRGARRHKIEIAYAMQREHARRDAEAARDRQIARERQTRISNISADQKGE